MSKSSKCGIHSLFEVRSTSPLSVDFKNRDVIGSDFLKPNNASKWD